VTDGNGLSVGGEGEISNQWGKVMTEKKARESRSLFILQPRYFDLRIKLWKWMSKEGNLGRGRRSAPTGEKREGT